LLSRLATPRPDGKTVGSVGDAGKNCRWPSSQ
jgi:hypothetical protein